MRKPPMFMDAGGFTVRVNPRSSPTGYVCLQIMEPPQYDYEKGITLRDGKFNEIYLTAEQAKQLADVLHAESVIELIGT